MTVSQQESVCKEGWSPELVSTSIESFGFIISLFLECDV